MHVDPQTLIAVGVGFHLLAALAKAIWKTPRQQTQIDALESKLDEVLAQMKGVVK